MMTNPPPDAIADISATNTEDNEKSRIQRLGRSRPREFQSVWVETAFLSCIAMSLLLDEYLASGFVSLVPRLAIELDLSRSFTTWAVSVVPLIVSSFLLAFGRLADLHGFYVVYLGGLTWVLIWSFTAAFAKHRVLLVCCRAMQGFGSAAHLSAGLGMLGAIYRPGPRKNLVFSLYGAMAPLGSFLGLATGGLVSQYTHWRWYFWIGALLAGVSWIGIWTTAPRRLKASNKDLQMDWLGCLTISTGVVMSVFTVTELAHAQHGWKTPYIIASGSVALLALGSAIYIEGWVARHPLLPVSVLKVDCVRPVLIGLLLNYGTIGIYMLYATLYIRNIIGANALQLIAWFTPMAVGGCFLAIFGGFLLHLVPGKIMFLISGTSGIAASLMFALAPSHANFWNCVLPAMIFATISIDLVFNCANVFFSTSLPRSQQGLAGGLSNALLHLSVAVQLGFAEVVTAGTSYQGKERSYKNVFWFAVACGTAALIISVLFVRIGKATSELTAEEKLDMDANDHTRVHEAETTLHFSNGTRSTVSMDIVDYKSTL